MARFDDAFMDWFGDSKVVDKHGRPLLVYHGTSISFEKLRAPAWFTTSLDEAKREYAKRHGGKSRRIIRAYLSIENPLLSEFVDEIAELPAEKSWREKQAKKGFDGVGGNPYAAEVVQRGPYAHGFYWVPFFSEQILVVE